MPFSALLMNRLSFLIQLWTTVSCYGCHYRFSHLPCHRPVVLDVRLINSALERMWKETITTFFHYIITAFALRNPQLQQHQSSTTQSKLRLWIHMRIQITAVIGTVLRHLAAMAVLPLCHSGCQYFSVLRVQRTNWEPGNISFLLDTTTIEMLRPKNNSYLCPLNMFSIAQTIQYVFHSTDNSICVP